MGKVQNYFFLKIIVDVFRKSNKMISRIRKTQMNTIIAKPKPKTQEWLRRSMKVTGLKAPRLIEALLEQEAEKVLKENQPKKPAA